MKKISMIIEQEYDQKTVHYIVLKILRISSGAYSRLKFSGGITLNGKQAYSRDKVRTGQLLRVDFPENGTLYPDLPQSAIQLCIAYEDADYYIIDKPAGIPTMYSCKQGGDTLETVIYQYLGSPDNYVFRPINRLDKGTSGLMAVAKHSHAQQLLQKDLHTDRFIREYTALCKGHLPAKEGIICAPIKKMEDSIKRCVADDGKPAITAYRVQEEGREASLVHLRLQTGRTHQIRVHMAYLGCPLWGDYVYGEEDTLFPGCFALHSSSISFIQPITGEKIHIDSKAPALWAELLKR